MKNDYSNKLSNNNKGLIVLVILLAILVLALGTFLVYDKVVTKENEPNKEDSNKVMFHHQ